MRQHRGAPSRHSPFAATVSHAPRARTDIVGRRASEILSRSSAQRSIYSEFRESLAMYLPTNAARYVSPLGRVSEDVSAESAGGRMMLALLAFRRTWRGDDADLATVLAERAYADGLLLHEQGPEAFQISQIVYSLVCADRLDAAQRVLDEQAVAAQTSGSRYGVWVGAYLRSRLAYRRGALADAEADAQLAIEITRSADLTLGTVAAISSLVEALVERGAFDEASSALASIGMDHGEVLAAAPSPNLILAARGRLRLARRVYHRRARRPGGLWCTHREPTRRQLDHDLMAGSGRTRADCARTCRGGSFARCRRTRIGNEVGYSHRDLVGPSTGSHGCAGLRCDRRVGGGR